MKEKESIVISDNELYIRNTRKTEDGVQEVLLRVTPNDGKIHAVDLITFEEVIVPVSNDAKRALCEFLKENMK